MLDCSVIIVNWNVRELLYACVTSLRRQQGVAFEIFVVDNASSDGSAEMVAKAFPEVTLIANKQNLGFARANNQAIQRARGRVLLLLNPDTVVHEGALAGVVQYLDAHREVGILGGKIVGRDGRVQRSVRRDPDPVSQLLILLKLHAFFPSWRPFRRYFAADIDPDREADIEQIMGAFFAIRGSLVSSIGLLDEGFFLWFEEVDYCKRARDAGWKIRYVPSLTITHWGGESFGQLLNVEQQIIFNRSLLRYARKHFSPILLLPFSLLSALSILLSLAEPIIRRLYVPKPIR